MHRNPVVRGLVLTPEEWNWSSYRHYALEEQGPVLTNERRRRRCGRVELHSVRWLASSCMGPWCPLAEKRGEWGSLDCRGARS